METMILCRSADRRNKEQAMHEKFSRRIETALERLAARIARSKRRLDPALVNRQIGRSCAAKMDLHRIQGVLDCVQLASPSELDLAADRAHTGGATGVERAQ